jgi:hypothetical protein
MKRRIIIASVLFVIGTLVYLSLSRGPMRVQLATVPVQLVYLLSISCLAWVAPLGTRGRLGALLGTVFVMSTLSTILDSFVIMALRPLHPVYFATGFLGFLIEGLLFLGLTWLVDCGIEALQIRRR